MERPAGVGALYSSIPTVNLSSPSLRSDTQVSYCVCSTWFSRSFKSYFDALDFVERLRAKYKRIAFLSIDVSNVLIDNLK